MFHLFFSSTNDFECGMCKLKSQTSWCASPLALCLPVDCLKYINWSLVSGGQIQKQQAFKETYLTILCVYLKWFDSVALSLPPLPSPSSPSVSFLPLVAPWHFLPSLSSTFLPRQRANQHTISLLTGKPDYQAIAVRSEYKPVQNMVNILPTTTSLEVCM